MPPIQISHGDKIARRKEFFNGLLGEYAVIATWNPLTKGIMRLVYKLKYLSVPYEDGEIRLIPSKYELIYATQTTPGVLAQFTADEIATMLSVHRNVRAATGFVEYVTGNVSQSTDWDSIALQILPITGTIWEFNEGNYFRGTASLIGDLTLFVGVGLEIRAALAATRGEKVSDYLALTAVGCGKSLPMVPRKALPKNWNTSTAFF